MTGGVLTSYVHLVLTVFLVGYVLYWAIMVISLRRTCDAAETQRLLTVAARSRWPHVAVPWTMRLPLPWMGWSFLALLIVSGLALLAQSSSQPLLLVKVVLIAGFVVIQTVLTWRQVESLIFVNFALALVIVVLSALLTRM